MLTKNYYNILAGQMLKNSGDTIPLWPLIIPEGYDGPTRQNDTIIKKCADALGFQSMESVVTSLEANSQGTLFGDGTEDPSIDDVTLSGNVIKNITATTSCTVIKDAGGVKKTVVFTITNDNSNAVTISEVGYCHYPSMVSMLLDHTLLEQPVTIGAGGVGQVTYTIRMNYPTV